MSVTEKIQEWFYGTNEWNTDFPEGSVQKLQRACTEAPVTMLIIASAIALLGLWLDQHCRGGTAFDKLSAFVVEHKEGAIGLALLILGTRGAYMKGKEPKELTEEDLYKDTRLWVGFNQPKVTKFSKFAKVCKENPVITLIGLSAIAMLGLWLDHHYRGGSAFSTLTNFVAEHKEGAIGLGLLILGARGAYMLGEWKLAREAKSRENIFETYFDVDDGKLTPVKY